MRMNQMPGQKQFIKDHYIYIADFGTINFGDTATTAINIETDAEFILVKMGAQATIAGAAQTSDSRVIPLCDLTINDTGSGRNLQNSAVPLDLITGDGKLPFVFPVPRKFRQNATITLTLLNITAATNYADVKIALIGYKKFLM